MALYRARRLCGSYSAVRYTPTRRTESEAGTEKMRYSMFAWAAVWAAAGATFAEVHPTGVPALSSRPGAAYTIYLDFAGFSFTGTWVNGMTPGVTPAYDNTVGSFSAQDQANIAEVWARVAEKYAAFDINVTTIDPAVAAGQAGTDIARQAYYDSAPRLMHTVVGGTGTWYGSAGTTGVSGIRTDQNTYTTGWNNGAGKGFHTNWAFSGQVGSNLKALGEIASHENGHGLGLSHQSDFSGTKLVNEYSTNNNVSGNGSYAPVMGASYYSQRGTWRVGTSDQSGPVAQNDVQTILSNVGMGGFVNDGIGHAAPAATLLPLSGSAVDFARAAGVIVPASTAAPTPIGVSNYVSDYFWFRTDGTGPLTLTAVDGGQRLTPGVADPGATLRSTLSILDASLNVVATATLAGSTMSETFSGTLPAGRYIAVVASAGGYQSASDLSAQYFDVGSYFLTGSGFSAAKWMAGASGGDWAVAANWLGQVVPQPSEDVVIPAGAVVTHSTGDDTARGLTVGGTLAVNGGTLAASSLSMSAGATLTGSADFQISGASTWAGGAMTGAGHTVVGARGSLTVSVGGGMTLSRTIDNAGTVTLVGGGNWTLAAGGGGAIVNSGTLATSGSGVAAVQASVSNTGTVAVRGGGLSLAGGLTDGAVVKRAGSVAGSIVVDAGASLVASFVRQGSLTSAGAVSLRRAADGGDTSLVGSLALTGSGTLDVADNRLVVATGGADAVRSYLQSAYDAGKWNGPGLTSSVAEGDPSGRLAIGFATAGELNVSAWGGVSGLTGGEVVTRLTVFGDANLDGVINADDFALTDIGMRQQLSGWVYGDFDYSGRVDQTDYWLLDRAYLLQIGGVTSPGMLADREAEFGADYVERLVASVPEPVGTMGGMMSLGLLVRRRRGAEKQ